MQMSAAGRSNVNDMVGVMSMSVSGCNGTAAADSRCRCMTIMSAINGVCMVETWSQCMLQCNASMLSMCNAIANAAMQCKCNAMAAAAENAAANAMLDGTACR